MRSQIGIVILFMLLLATSAAGHDWNHQDFVQNTPAQRDWLNKQRQPGTRYTCCTEADGEQVDEQIRYDDKGIGRYWIYSRHTRGEWMLVPEEVIIREPNMHGRPVAWFRWGATLQTLPRSDLMPVVFCFVPGPLM